MSFQSKLAEELRPLLEASNGKFHRDEAIEYFVKNKDVSESEIAERLEENISFDDRGFAYLTDTSIVDVDSFGGDIGELAQPPGHPTAEDFHGLPVLKRPTGGHPLIPSTDEYFERTLPHTDSTDVEVLCQTLADADFNPLLVGDAGTGKDTLIQYVCAQTNRPVTRVNFGSEVRYEDLVGMYTLNEDGEMTWQDGYLTAAVRYGWVFVADELNAAPPESTMPLHQVTEERDKASLVLRNKSESIDPHPQFRFIGTMNPVYTGTNELNDAFKSRFYSIEIDYLEPDREAKLIKQQLDDSMALDDSDVGQLCGLAADLRDRHSAGDLRTPITTRELLKIAKLTRTMNVREATETILLGHVSDRDERLVADTLDQVL